MTTAKLHHQGEDRGQCAESGSFPAVRLVQSGVRHAPQGEARPALAKAHAPGLNMGTAGRPGLASGPGPCRLRSPKRQAARIAAAQALGAAMRRLRLSSADVGAALDCAAEDVRAMLAGEKPFEVGHVALLPEALRAAVLAPMVEKLGEAFEGELRAGREGRAA